MNVGTQHTETYSAYFDLVSVLYHALKGGAVYAQYIQDAQQAADQELAQFFQQVLQEDRLRAERAMALLAQRQSVGQPGPGFHGPEPS